VRPMRRLRALDYFNINAYWFGLAFMWRIRVRRLKAFDIRGAMAIIHIVDAVSSKEVAWPFVR